MFGVDLNNHLSIGDRCRALIPVGNTRTRNLIGTVIDLSSRVIVGLQFDEYIHGHSCGYKGKDGYCWNLDYSDIELVMGGDIGMRKYAVSLVNSDNKYFNTSDELKNFLVGVSEKEVIDIYEYTNTYVRLNKCDFVFSSVAQCNVDAITYPLSEMEYLTGFGYVHKSNLDKVTTCQYCGKTMLKSEENHIANSDEYACDVCISRRRFIRCHDCGKLFPYSGIIHINDSNDYICYDCLESNDDISTCSNCGSYYYNDSLTYSESHEAYFCENCYESCTRSIGGYHHTRNLKFIQCNEESTKRYFGIELEIGGYSEDDTVMADYAIDAIKYLECKSDSSIHRGFEMVTNPMTYKYLMSIKNNWERVLNKAKERGFKSNAEVNCGMHIHISRNSFTNTEAIDRLCQIFECFWDNAFDFSRRNEDQLEWCGRYWGSGKLKKKRLKEIVESSDDRYRAVNLTNSATVEFRIFNGTLTLSTFYANIQFINRLCDIVNTYSETEFNDLTWEKIINGDSQYDDLIEYGKRHMGNNPNTTIKSCFEEEVATVINKGALDSSNLNDIIEKLYSNQVVWNSFPVGTRVRIANLYGISRSRGDIGILHSMASQTGEWRTIESVSSEENDVYDITYRLVNTTCSWTIDMFDAFILPVGTELNTIEGLHWEKLDKYNIPFSAPEYMRVGKYTIENNDWSDLFDCVRYKEGKFYCSYNNWMFKETALLNLAIRNGTSYDTLGWL